MFGDGSHGSGEMRVIMGNCYAGFAACRLGTAYLKGFASKGARKQCHDVLCTVLLLPEQNGVERKVQGQGGIDVQIDDK